MVKYDPCLNLSTAIVEVLQQYGSANPKEIRIVIEPEGVIIPITEKLISEMVNCGGIK